MNPVIERFFQVLSEIVPDYKNYLNPPCDPAKFEVIENLIGEELPKAFKEFYSIADGEPQYSGNLNVALGGRFMSLDEVIAEYGWKNDIINENGNYDYDYYDLCMSYNGNRVKSGIMFHRKWLAIIQSGDTDYFSLDYVPNYEGAKGQIILHNVAGDAFVWYDYAPSFEGFILLVTNLLVEDKIKFRDGYYFETDTYAIGKSICVLPTDNTQKEKFKNLSPEWLSIFTEYCKSNFREEATLEKLTEIYAMRWGYYNENSQFQDLTEQLFTDITPLILLPRLKAIGFSHQISLSELDFVSKYLTQIYSLYVSEKNIFQQEDLKIIGNFRCLFELNIHCGKIEDFSAFLSCKYLARLTLVSSEKLNLSALSELKELKILNICACPNIVDFSPLSDVKNPLNIQMTREQFLKAVKYMDKSKITTTDFRNSQGTDAENAIINEWFAK